MSKCKIFGHGRESAPTAVEFSKNGAGLNILKQWKKMIDAGYAGNFGRNYDDTQNAFI